MAWFEQAMGLTCGRTMELIYSVINDSFALPPDTKHSLVTLTHARDVFLELDQYPPQTIPRPAETGALPPGVAIATFRHPDFGALNGPWITPPMVRDGAMYGARRTGTLSAPDGTLVEIVEAG
jgi:hypothetical protein